MNKQDLIDYVAKQVGITKADSERCINAIIKAIFMQLSKGKRLKIVGLGTFAVNTRLARNGRNPQTGEAIRIPKGKFPKFIAGALLKEKVR